MEQSHGSCLGLCLIGRRPGPNPFEVSIYSLFNSLKKRSRGVQNPQDLEGPAFLCPRYEHQLSSGLHVGRRFGMLKEPGHVPEADVYNLCRENKGKNQDPLTHTSKGRLSQQATLHDAQPVRGRCSPCSHRRATQCAAANAATPCGIPLLSTLGSWI